jgi:hypothetical protein
MAPRTLEEMLVAVEELAKRFEQQDFDTVEPLAAVRAAFEARTLAEKHLADRIAAARTAGRSWAAIGESIGTSGEAARQRYGRSSS